MPTSKPGNLNLEAEGIACRQAVAYGIDLSLLADNLRLTPEQRMQRHDGALAVALELRQAMVTSSVLRAPCSALNHHA